MLRALALLLCCAGPAAALELSLPANARQTVERNTAPDRYAAPVGVFAEGQVARVEIDGDVHRAAWRLQSLGLTPLQVIRPLRAQLIEAGFEIVLDCASKQCGGFDFRFATETLPGPNMYVNIREYHFVTALRRTGDVPQEVVTLFASTSANSAYVQIIQAGRLAAGSVAVSPDADVPTTTQSVAQDDLVGTLLKDGHVILADLDFDTGTSDLGAGPFASLERLAALLKERPTMRIALVGHTDTVGSLENNIALSRRRAQSVRQRMIETYDLAGARMEAEGMGYLAPVASNLNAAGREANRRVEVVVLSDE